MWCFRTNHVFIFLWDEGKFLRNQKYYVRKSCQFYYTTFLCKCMYIVKSFNIPILYKVEFLHHFWFTHNTIFNLESITLQNSCIYLKFFIFISFSFFIEIRPPTHIYTHNELFFVVLLLILSHISRLLLLKSHILSFSFHSNRFMVNFILIFSEELVQSIIVLYCLSFHPFSPGCS